MTPPKISVSEVFRRWWFLILAIFGLVAESAVAEYRLSQVEDALEKQEQSKEQLIRIEERQTQVKEAQAEIKIDIKEILKELRSQRQ